MASLVQVLSCYVHYDGDYSFLPLVYIPLGNPFQVLVYILIKLLPLSFL